MKRTIPIFLVVLASIFTFSNFKHSVNSSSNFVFTQLIDGPDLPEIALDYSNIQFPDHLLANPFEAPDTSSGYTSGGVDSLAFENITDDGATLGRVLFYDEKLSALENISCASCHNQAFSFADNSATSEGVSTNTRRNSMHLNDIAWTNNESFFWDMSQTNLNEMIRLPLKDENEIGANIEDVVFKLSLTEYYPELFTKAFGSSKITEDRIVEALVQFLESMTTFNSRFDQEAKNNFQGFTQLEKEGQDLFGASCATCHSQGKHSLFGEIIFTDPDLPLIEVFPFIFNNGLPATDDDLGAGEWLPGFDHLFKPPSLRNIDLTGPYMHDGSIKSLEEVIQFYSEETEENEWSLGFIPVGGFQFSDHQKSALLAFLKTLTDETFLENEKWSDPFSLVGTVEAGPEIESLVLRPNPMQNSSIIEWQNDNQEATSISIYDISGKMIISEVTTASSFQLNKHDLLEGMYVIEITQKDKRSARRLVVQ